MSEVLKTKGNECFKRGEYKKAAKLYRDAIALDPHNAVLYSNRAMCFEKLEDWARVVDDSTSGIALAKKDQTALLVKLYYRQGLGRVRQGAFSAAEESFSHGLELDRGNTLILKEMARLEQQKQQKQQKQQQQQQQQQQQKQNQKEQKQNKQQAAGVQRVPVKTVAQLPSEFEYMLYGKISESQPSSQQKSQTHASGENTETPQRDNVPADTEYQRWASVKEPTVAFLLTVTKSAHREAGYRYVLQISPQWYKTLFGVAGTEEWFLQFYMDAIVWECESGVFAEQEAAVLETLLNFSQFPRFALSKMFVPQQKLEHVFETLRKAVGSSSLHTLQMVTARYIN